jgi:hypothetical protein
MSIKKSLVGLAAVVMVTMAFASPAMAAEDGTLVDHQGTNPIAAGTVLHLIGWKKNTTNSGSYECHATLNIQATGSSGTTGDVTAFTIPDTTKCTGTGLHNGCKLKAHSTTNLPYHATVTSNGRIVITGNIVFHEEYKECLVKRTTLTYTSIELTPLKTDERAVTGTEGKLGTTAALNETIAGFEIDGTTGGVVHIENIFGGKEEAASSTSGEFELTAPERCTYEIIAP